MRSSIGNEVKRVVWLCTFTNAEKRSHLTLWRRGASETGQWIPNLLRAFEGDDRDYEIHVVSTEHWMRKPIEIYSHRNIFYHCFQTGMPVLGRSWPARFPADHLTGFRINRRRIARILMDVKPHLIHLFGVENPQYGSAVLDCLNQYPVLVNIQGFIHRERHYHDGIITRVRCRYEEKLLRACSSYLGDYDSEAVVRKFAPNASYRHFYFPVNEKLIEGIGEVTKKEYDILFAGGMTKQKGFCDFLEVVRLLKKDMPEIKAGVVGYAHVYPEAVPFIEKHGLQRNVIWLGRFPSQEGLFKVFRQSKLFIAPTYNDCFASTLRENMLLGTPCVAYRTGGIPYANRNGAENIVLIDQGDLKGLFERVLQLLNNNAKRVEIAVRAQAFAQREFSLQANVAVIKEEYARLVGAVSG